MKKVLLVLALLGSAEAATKLNGLTAALRQNGIGVGSAGGGILLTITEPNSGELVELTFTSDGANGRPLRSGTLEYRGPSFDGGMYAIGLMSGALETCFSQKVDHGEDAAVFVQSAVQKGFENGTGRFRKTFGTVTYTVVASNPLLDDMQIRVNLAIPKTATTRCTQ